MFSDARGVPPGSSIDSDICIVGAGAAGIALALELAAAELRVCLLESGGLDAREATQALAQGDSVGRAYSAPDSVQLRFLGGNTNAWGGWFRGLDEIDFLDRAWVEDSGWPFDASALAPHLARAHALCEVPSADYSIAAAAAIADPGARLIPSDPRRLESVLYRFSPPTRFASAYRETLGRTGSINCVTNAHALKIATTRDTRRVTGIEVGCLGGARFAVTARVFILAAGAIENARLLLLSNDAAPAGLGNAHDLVGRYLMDHPHTRRALLPGPRQFPFGLYGLAFRDRGIAAGLSLPAALQRQEKLLNYKGSIYPVFHGDGSASWEAAKNLALSFSRKWGADPYDRLRLPFARKRVGARQLLGWLAHPHELLLGALAETTRSPRLMRGLVLESKLEQAPNPASRVTLQESRDEFGLPRARIDWRLLPIDRKSLVRAEHIIDAELQRIGIGRLAPLSPAEREDWPADFAGGWHQLGTTRMDADPRRGVVDAQCRVHGVGNLFIAGASVFPTGGAVSPMPTLLALSLRLAAHVKQLLRQPLAIDGPRPRAAGAMPAPAAARLPAEHAFSRGLAGTFAGRRGLLS